MCGICGILSRHKTPGIDRVGAMMDALAHRGPDDQGIAVLGQAALGHRRLSIIDLAGGAQPMSNEDGTIRFVGNGEIYNYRSIRRKLEHLGHVFHTNSDNEVIVHLYEECGEACVHHLRGMFAFALYDDRKQRLLAARDHLGQKPLFYAECDNELLFASEIKGILAAAPELNELDPGALDQYLALRLVAPPLTMYRQIRKLPPAHLLTWTAAHGVRVTRYWTPEYEPKWDDPEDTLLDRLEQEMLQALELHLVSDVPVGAFLSGGLDSPLIVALIRAHGLAENLSTFSLSLPWGEYDEAPAARKVAERYETDHHEWTLDAELAERIPDVIYRMDEPSDPLALCQFILAERTSRHVKVVLGGEGGDELLGGYDRYYGDQFVERYARVPRMFRTWLMGPALKLLSDGKWYKSRGHQAKWLHALSFLKDGERYARSLNYFYFAHQHRMSLYTSEWREQLADSNPLASISTSFDEARAVHPVDRMMASDLAIRLPDHPTMIFDRMTMAHGLEGRAPFMDHTLAEFAARLPVRLKVRGRTTRWLQRRLAERYLPPELMARPKQGFSSGLTYLLAGQLHSLFREYLTDSALVDAGILRPEPVAHLLEEHTSRQADHGQRLWLILSSEIWLRSMLERGTKGNTIADHDWPSQTVRSTGEVIQS